MDSRFNDGYYTEEQIRTFLRKNFLRDVDYEMSTHVRIGPILLRLIECNLRMEESVALVELADDGYAVLVYNSVDKLKDENWFPSFREAREFYLGYIS
ncbi:MAG: hypothetical protein J6Y78_09730 [Paludibacteraceae bacterium]|nr:hypothetical protein [Paludibacteraceae bacterium]